MKSLKISKVFIVDDHELVRKGLCQLIEGEYDLELCGQAASVREALNLRKKITPDVAIVDISLPDGSGLDLIKLLLNWRPNMHIIVLSMHDDMIYAERAINQGAMGYINKQDSVEKLLLGIRSVINGKIFVNPQVAKCLKGRLLNETNSTTSSPINQLTDRELQIFEAIGDAKKTNQIAKELHLSIKTIESHRSNIKKKFGLSSGLELTRAALLWFLEKN